MSEHPVCSTYRRLDAATAAAVTATSEFGTSWMADPASNLTQGFGEGLDEGGRNAFLAENDVQVVFLEAAGRQIMRQTLERAYDDLRESEQRFRDYAETASDWFWATGPSTT